MLRQTYISPLSPQNAAREETGERMGFLFSLSPSPPPPFSGTFLAFASSPLFRFRPPSLEQATILEMYKDNKC